MECTVLRAQVGHPRGLRTVYLQLISFLFQDLVSRLTTDELVQQVAHGGANNNGIGRFESVSYSSCVQSIK